MTQNKQKDQSQRLLRHYRGKSSLTQDEKHVEILDIGSPLWQQHYMDELKRQLEVQALERNKQLKETTLKTHEESLNMLRKKHEEYSRNREKVIYETLNQHFLEELTTVEELQNGEIEVIVDKNLSKGRLFLRATIKDSRKMFEIEKKLCIENLVTNEKGKREIYLSNEAAKHDRFVSSGELQSRWRLKIEAEKTRYYNEFHGKLDKELQLSRDLYKKQMISDVDEMILSNRHKVESLRHALVRKEEVKKDIVAEKERLAKTGNNLIKKMDIIMEAYKTFIEVEFTEDQVHLLLYELVPGPFYEEV